MAARDFKPPEEKTSPVTFFVLGILMVVVTMWTVWDEVFTRRPWKDYQRRFNQYERQLVEKDLAKARKGSGAQVAQIDVQIKSLEEKLAKDPDLAALKANLEKVELETFERVQDFQFTKSEFDAAYFHHQEGIRRGQDVTVEAAHAEEIKQRMDRLKPISEKAEAARDAVKAQIKAKEKALTDLRRRRRRAASEISSFERRLKAIAGRPYEIKQIILREYDRNNFGEPVIKVDRCQTCHLAIFRAGFENASQPFRTHPDRDFYLKRHDTVRMGCTSCHGGQGSALTSVDKAHGYVPFWEDPLLKGAEAQTKCHNCHAGEFNLKRAPNLARGISLVREIGCFGCHNIPGTGGIRKRGPDLSRIQEKVSPAWLVSWIRKPKDYNPRTKMPFFSLSDEETRDIATYIWRAGRRKAAAQKISGLADPALAAKGKEIFETAGCLGCHVRDARDDNPGPALEGVNGRPVVIRNRDFAPALGRIAQKVQPDWLVRWLKNPKAYWHETAMPSLRLSDDEAKAVAAHLLSLAPPKGGARKAVLGDASAFERGKRLAAKRGCPGCHVIPGLEAAGNIGPDLANFAVKKPFELSFGNVVKMEKTWEAWTFGKLKNPKIYQTGREKLLMPNFDLSDEEAASIRIFMRDMVPHGPPHSVHYKPDERARRIEAGRRMIEKYNCNGCHVVENWGGGFLRRLKDKNNGPPFLDGEGVKVQPDWFFGFLRNVTILRPWLKVRMPSFGMPEKDAAALVNYFAALDGKLRPYVHFDKTQAAPESLRAGRELFEKAECLSCHGEWPPPPGREPPTAPNLLLAKDRLRPDWIFRWIMNPPKIRPGTKMPVFFEGAGDRAEIVKGVRGEQENGSWIYTLESREEAELAEEKPATLRLGGQSFLVKVLGIDEKKIKVSIPRDLGKTIAKAELVSHGEPIDEELLGGDGFRQLRALRDYLMVEDKFPEPPKAEGDKSEAEPKPEAESPGKG